MRRMTGILLAGASLATAAAAQTWVSGGAGGLRYGAAANGDRVPDFSEAGYGRAGERIPLVPVRITLSPAPAGDDAPRIQAALDRLASAPLANGFRGAVALAPGRYRIGTTLRIAADGVVLRGAGSGTVLEAQAGVEPLIALGGRAAWRRDGPSVAIVDDYVPVGATTIHVASAAGIGVGDGIIVDRPFTAAFIARIGMDRLTAKAGGPVAQWRPGAGLAFFRRVTAVNGTAVSLDAPVMDGIARADGGAVWRASLAGAISHAGVEQLAASADPHAAARGISAAASFVVVDGVENGWVRGIRLTGFATYADVRAAVTDVTVDDVAGRLDRAPWWPVPQPIFQVAGQRVLVSRCAAVSDRATLAATQSRTAGPVVFSDCRGSGGDIAAGPHQRWAAGILFDRVAVTGGLLVENRGSMGSGQGWSGTSVVLWNSRAGLVSLQEAPGAHNWAFGTSGRRKPPTPGVEPGSDVSPDAPVAPQSLFVAQLAARR